MTNRKANSTQKTFMATAAKAHHYRTARQEQLLATPLNDVFTELALLIGGFDVSIRRAITMRPVDDVCTFEEQGIDTWLIQFEINLPFRARFKARCQKPTLHEAAIEAVVVALAWFGIDEDDQHPGRQTA